MAGQTGKVMDCPNQSQPNRSPQQAVLLCTFLWLTENRFRIFDGQIHCGIGARMSPRACGSQRKNHLTWIRRTFTFIFISILSSLNMNVLSGLILLFIEDISLSDALPPKKVPVQNFAMTLINGVKNLPYLDYRILYVCLDVSGFSKKSCPRGLCCGGSRWKCLELMSS